MPVPFSSSRSPGVSATGPSPLGQIAVIILNWNGKADTLACLHSVGEIDYAHFETIVVDNGSTDGSSEAIRAAFPGVIVIENGSNLGFAEGNNVGIRYALHKGAEYVFLLNNDTVVDPQILQAFMQTFSRCKGAGILGAKTYLFDKRGVLDHLGGRWNRKRGAFDLIGLREVDDGLSWEEPIEIDYVCGAALIASRRVWEEVGLLDPRFFLIWEESDLCFRARKAGFRTYTAPAAKVWHKVSASFVGKPHSTYYWWRNRLLWIERNCAKREKWRIYCTVLLPDIAHMWKMRLIKTCQLKLLRWIRPREDLTQREDKLFKTRAALQGVQDYFCRRFGSCPSWLLQKRQKE